MTDHSEVGDLHLATVVINVQDMERAVAFWEAALGYQRREAEWDAEFMMLVDLYTDEQDRHIERLVGLGASRVDDWPYPDDADFVVLRDPDGNEFCVTDHAQLQ